MNRSFRFRLSLRFSLAMLFGVAALSTLSYLAIRAGLDAELDASLLSVASIQAATVTDSPSGAMAFHEWELTPEEAAQVRDLNRFAQVWDEDGQSLLRTQYATEDLPLDTAALRAALGGELVQVEDVFQSLPVRSLYYPLGRFGPMHGQHVLQVAAPLESRDRLLRQALWLMLGLGTIVVAGTMAGSWWLAGRAVRPVHEITDQADEIGAGTLGRRISAYADSREYERLVQVLNTMLARIDTAFEAQRRFTADASHELRSPLTALRGELELARRRRREPEEYERVIESALEEVGRLTRVSEDLLTLARSDSGVLEARPERIDLRSAVERVVDRLQAGASRKNVTLELSSTSDPVHVTADEHLIGRLLWNLVENALKFTPPGGRVRVELRIEGDEAVLRVVDSGPGVPAESLPRIFDRFFRADEARTSSADTPGTGLGLAIAKAIAGLHGATLVARNRAGGGAEFVARFTAGRTTDTVSRPEPTEPPTTTATRAVADR
jgi:two-component system OmpR family sensor kinase